MLVRAHLAHRSPTASPATAVAIAVTSGTSTVATDSVATAAFAIATDCAPPAATVTPHSTFRAYHRARSDSGIGR